MFKEGQFGQSGFRKPAKKSVEKNPLDTQTDLYADFERADLEQLVPGSSELEPDKLESLKEPLKPSGVGVYPSPEELAEMIKDSERRIEEAQKWQAGERSRRNAAKFAEFKGMSLSEMIKYSNQKKIAEDAAKKAAREEEAAAVQKLKDSINDRRKLVEQRDPADDIDEDGFVKPSTPSEEYYGRYRR